MGTEACATRAARCGTGLRPPRAASPPARDAGSSRRARSRRGERLRSDGAIDCRYEGLPKGRPFTSKSAVLATRRIHERQERPATNLFRGKARLQRCPGRRAWRMAPPPRFTTYPPAQIAHPCQYAPSLYAGKIGHEVLGYVPNPERSRFVDGQASDKFINPGHCSPSPQRWIGDGSSLASGNQARIQVQTLRNEDQEALSGIS